MLFHFSVVVLLLEYYFMGMLWCIFNICNELFVMFMYVLDIFIYMYTKGMSVVRCDDVMTTFLRLVYQRSRMYMFCSIN